MRAVIEPGNIAGILNAPPSKSHTQRAYAAALLHQGTTIIRNAGNSADEKAALDIIQRLGAHVSIDDDEFVVSSNGPDPVNYDIDCGESGLAARLFTPIAALSDKHLTINGSGTLLRRRMEGFAEALLQLGVKLNGFNGYLPFTIGGPLIPRDITLDAGGGSQFISGLLFALAFQAESPVTLTVRNLKSRPYIDMTLEVLAHFGYSVTHNRYREFFITPRERSHEMISVDIEGDWSSASFFLVAGAIAGEMTVTGLNISSSQADRSILGVLEMCGANVGVGETSIAVSAGNLREFEFNATHSPDLFPALAILGACCDGESYIKGVHRLFDKESNRVESVTEMLFDFGVPFSVEDDTLHITGVDSLQGTIIDSYHDHRIAMAAAIGALRAKSQVDILHAEAVSKSYPGFFTDLQLCGGKCTFISE